MATQEQASSFRDEIFHSSLEPYTQSSIDFLKQICQDEEPFTHLTYDSFVALNSNTVPEQLTQNFSDSIVISKAELRAQVAFDLCRYYLYDKKYDLAREKALECRDNLAILKKEYDQKADTQKTDKYEFLFCSFAEDELQGYLLACGVDETANHGLLNRMNESIYQNYKVNLCFTLRSHFHCFHIFELLFVGYSKYFCGR